MKSSAKRSAQLKYMQILQKGLVITLLAAMMGQTEDVNSLTAIHNQPASPLIVQTQPTYRNVRAVVPNYAEIVLKTSGSKFGKLKAIDSKNQNLTIVLQNEQSEQIAISRVEKVLFRIADGTVMGKELPRPQGEIRTWPNVSLTNLKILNKGNSSEVKVPCAIDASVCQEHGTIYTIREILFPTKEKITLVISAES